MKVFIALLLSAVLIVDRLAVAQIHTYPANAYTGSILKQD